MVLLTLKNLQQQTFTVEIDMSLTVKDLKEKIEKDKGDDYPASGQKLIYAGKILQDDNKLETYISDVNKFLVIMVTKQTKPPAAAAPSASSESSSQQTSESTAPTPAQTESSTTSSTTTTSSASTTSSSASPATTTSTTTTSSSSTPAASAESMLVMGDEFNAMVQNIMEMGYDRPDVERALRASFNNPYTAVQYLVDGIPEDSAQEDRAVQDAPAVPATGDGAAAAAAAPAVAPAAGEDPLAFLQNQPQFRQMTQMMRTNPQLLDAFLQQIRSTNPSLLQAIQDNQEAFVRMINEQQAGGDGSAAPAAAPAAGGAAPGGGDRSTTIMLTPQDREAIDRLLLLGNFPEDLVVQAYFACEKNENQAAEFLFSQAFD